MYNAFNLTFTTTDVGMDSLTFYKYCKRYDLVYLYPLIKKHIPDEIIFYFKLKGLNIRFNDEHGYLMFNDYPWWELFNKHINGNDLKFFYEHFEINNIPGKLYVLGEEDNVKEIVKELYRFDKSINYIPVGGLY